MLNAYFLIFTGCCRFSAESCCYGVGEFAYLFKKPTPVPPLFRYRWGGAAANDGEDSIFMIDWQFYCIHAETLLSLVQLESSSFRIVLGFLS